MTRRCPNCGGLVGEGAAWCGQCLTSLAERPGPDEESVASPPPDPSVPPGPNGEVALRLSRSKQGSGRFRVAGDGLVWKCPQCDLENPLDASACARCGTPFRSLFEKEQVQASVDPGRATGLSLIFPGLGHRVLGRAAEGLARAVVFLWTMGMGVAILATAGGFNAGPFLPVVIVLFAAAAIVYGTTAADAGRIARGASPIMTSRMLLYGSTGLMFAVVAILVISGMRVSQG
jgi:hypothetical protein